MNSDNILDFKENLKSTPAETDQYFTRPKAYYSFFIHLINSTIISLLAGAIAYFIGFVLHLEESITNMLAQAFYTLAALILVLPFTYKTIINDLKRAKKKLLLVLLISVLFFIIYLSINLLYSQYIEANFIKLLVKINIISKETYNAFSTSQNQSELLLIFENNFSKWAIIPFIAIIGPLYEEIIFRKALFRLFNIKKPALNIIITGALFALIHVASSILIIISSLLTKGNTEYRFDNLILEFVFFFNYFISGVILGFIYCITGYNILPCFIVHMLNNAYTAAILIFFK